MPVFSRRFTAGLFATALITVLLCGGASTKDSRLARVEATAVELPAASGEAPSRQSLADLMNTHNVPGLSRAVIQNFKIVDMKAHGVVAPGSTTELNPKNDNGAAQMKKLKGETMNSNPKVVEQPGFTVVGVAARTSNAKEMTADGVIGKQWMRVMQEGLIGKIPNKADSSIVAVYTDYASDHDGEYTFLLGAKVTFDADVPAGMVSRKIPAGKFAVFTSEKGPAPQVVPALWMKINSLPKSAVGGDRTYRADFEIYDERATDPQNLQMDAYIGIR